MGKTLEELKAKFPHVERGKVDRGLDTLVECLMEDGGDEILAAALERLPTEMHEEVTELVKRLKEENT